MADNSDMLALRVYLDENYDFMVSRLPLGMTGVQLL